MNFCLSWETDTASISFWRAVIDIWWQIASGLDQWEFPVAGTTGNFERIWYMHGGQSYVLASPTILPRRFYNRSRAFVRIWTTRSHKKRLFCSLSCLKKLKLSKNDARAYTTSMLNGDLLKAQSLLQQCNTSKNNSETLFQVNLERILLKQLDYSLSISMRCYSLPLNFPLSSSVKTDHVIRSRGGTICHYSSPLNFLLFLLA